MKERFTQEDGERPVSYHQCMLVLERMAEIAEGHLTDPSHQRLARIMLSWLRHCEDGLREEAYAELMKRAARRG